MKLKLYSKKRLVFWIVGLLVASLVYIFGDGFYTFLPLAIYLITSICSLGILFLSGRKLRFSLGGTSQCEKGQNGEIVIKMTNDSWIPSIWTQGYMTLYNVATGEVLEEFQSFDIPGKKSYSLPIPFKTKYSGAVRTSINNLKLLGLLGVFYKEVSLQEEATTYILPTIKGVSLTNDDITGYDMESFKYSQYKKGDDPSEVFGIREYRQEDSSKLIHWKLSSKGQDIMVRELGFPIENNILVLLDKSMMEDDYDTLDSAIELFVSISDRILKSSIAHDIGWYDHEKSKFYVKTVSERGQLWIESIGVLNCPNVKDGKSLVSGFLESEYDKNYSNFLVVTTGLKDIERLLEYGAVKEFSPRQKN